ncbi:MAG TPA: hypothetical protein ENJ18_00085 [Nannocystis exedens]|nr:hypothetical protein [Nannocystis exedens]
MGAAAQGMPPMGAAAQGMPPMGGMPTKGAGAALQADTPQAAVMPQEAASTKESVAAVDEAPIRVTEPLASEGPDHPGAGLLSQGPLAVLESAPPIDSKPAADDGSVAPTAVQAPAAMLQKSQKSQEPGAALLVPPPPTARSGPSALVVIVALLVLGGIAAGVYFFVIA